MVSEMDDFERTFSADLLITGLDAIWCADFRIPCLVRIDTESLLPEPFLDLPPHDDEYGRLMGPGALRFGAGVVWVLERSGSVLRVDPQGRELMPLDTPFPFGDLAVYPGGLLGIEHFGEGRIARISFEGDVATSEVGRALRLLATDGDLVWTVDDAESAVLAIDVETLEVIERFPHVGGPDSLWAGDRQAWYLASRETLMDDGQRAAILMPNGIPCDLLHLDFGSGRIEHLTALHGAVPATTRDPEGFWVSGSVKDDFDGDPINRLWLVSELGEIEREFQLIGQVDSLCRDRESIWVSGFRRSVQRQVVSRFSPTGILLGEVDMSGIDVARWIPEPAPIQWPPLQEWAASVRDAVERGLTTPNIAMYRDGTQREVPPICEEFHYERTALRFEQSSALLDVIFSWEGEPGLFGRTFSLVQDEYLANSPDALVTVYLEEDLLAAGFGIENARHDLGNGVKWLSWPQTEGD